MTGVGRVVFDRGARDHAMGASRAKPTLDASYSPAPKLPLAFSRIRRMPNRRRPRDGDAAALPANDEPCWFRAGHPLAGFRRRL